MFLILITKIQIPNYVGLNWQNTGHFGHSGHLVFYGVSDKSRCLPAQLPLKECKHMLLNVLSGTARRCTARCKSRNLDQCRNPAAFDCRTCRVHGARRPDSVKRGPAHPQYRHGRETVGARQRRVEGMSRLRGLVDLAVDAGFIRTRITGRRPGSIKPSRR